MQGQLGESLLRGEPKVSITLVSSLSNFCAGRDNSSENHESFVPAGKLRSIASAVLVGIGYYVGTRIGFALTPKGQPNSTFWPPNAILLAAFLLAPRRSWWTFVLAILPVHLLAQLQIGVPVSTALGWFITNTGEALIGGFFITRLISRNKLFNSLRGVIVFIVFGVFDCPISHIIP
jgi:integral membrane sensor domain MASE1